MATLKLAGVLLIISHSLFARIGETLPECTRRYGKPSRAKDYEAERLGFSSEATSFTKDGIFVFISFFQGKADRVAFVKDGGEFSEDELNTLLKANGGGLDWRPIGDPTDIYKFWRTFDGSRFASYRFDALIIETATARARARAKEDAEEAKKKNESAKKMRGF